MAGASLLTLLDDIATLLDDVAMMTKTAAKQTAGVLGDDLALNAEQVSGVRAARELPVVWAVAKGSFLNKLMLVPAALLISAVAPWAITPLLMLGGAFLCFEGFEKLAHKWLHSAEEEQAHHQGMVAAIKDESVDMKTFERRKIRGAIRTDFILSAEIIVISLGTVAAATFIEQLAVLSSIAILVTVGVYGLVAAIVKIDDVGLYCTQQKGRAVVQALGRGLLSFAPKLMKTLTIVGTAAMFLVGGGILVHGVSVLHHWLQGAEAAAHLVPGVGAVLGVLTSMLFNAAVGIAAGGVLVGLFTLWGRLRSPAVASS
ncbi:MAG: DUF808 domain-containing protein [Oceanococcus sp.]